MAVLTPFFDIVAGVAILAGRSSLLDAKVFRAANNTVTFRQLLALGFIGYGGWNLWQVEKAQEKLKESLEAEGVSDLLPVGTKVRSYDFWPYNKDTYIEGVIEKIAPSPRCSPNCMHYHIRRTKTVRDGLEGREDLIGTMFMTHPYEDGWDADYEGQLAKHIIPFKSSEVSEIKGGESFAAMTKADIENRAAIKRKYRQEFKNWVKKPYPYEVRVTQDTKGDWCESCKDISARPEGEGVHYQFVLPRQDSWRSKYRWIEGDYCRGCGSDVCQRCVDGNNYCDSCGELLCKSCQQEYETYGGDCPEIHYQAESFNAAYLQDPASEYGGPTEMILDTCPVCAEFSNDMTPKELWPRWGKDDDIGYMCDDCWDAMETDPYAQWLYTQEAESFSAERYFEGAIGDEGMFKGGEIRIHDKGKYGYIIHYLDEHGNKAGDYIVVNKNDLEKAWSPFEVRKDMVKHRAESFSAESRDELIDTLIEIRQELAREEGMEDWENESEGPLDSLSSAFIQELIWYLDGDRDTWDAESFDGSCPTLEDINTWAKEYFTDEDGFIAQPKKETKYYQGDVGDEGLWKGRKIRIVKKDTDDERDREKYWKGSYIIVYLDEDGNMMRPAGRGSKTEEIINPEDYTEWRDSMIVPRKDLETEWVPFEPTEDKAWYVDYRDYTTTIVDTISEKLGFGVLGGLNKWGRQQQDLHLLFMQLAEQKQNGVFVLLSFGREEQAAFLYMGKMHEGKVVQWNEYNVGSGYQGETWVADNRYEEGQPLTDKSGIAWEQFGDEIGNWVNPDHPFQTGKWREAIDNDFYETDDDHIQMLDLNIWEMADGWLWFCPPDALESLGEKGVMNWGHKNIESFEADTFDPAELGFGDDVVVVESNTGYDCPFEVEELSDDGLFTYTVCNQPLELVYHVADGITSDEPFYTYECSGCNEGFQAIYTVCTRNGEKISEDWQVGENLYGWAAEQDSYNAEHDSYGPCGCGDHDVADDDYNTCETCGTIWEFPDCTSGVCGICFKVCDECNPKKRKKHYRTCTLEG